MPKRNRDDLMSISPRSELHIPQDAVQEILEKLEVKSLLRFKAVSKTWRKEIESSLFQERHLIRHQHKPRDPSILVFENRREKSLLDNDHNNEEVASTSTCVRTLSVGATTSSLSMENHTTYHLHPSTFIFPRVARSYIKITQSCDGLTCLYSEFLMYVINPATRWYRKVPESRCQERVKSLFERNVTTYIEGGRLLHMPKFPRLGFGKDDITGTYKLVWLYSSYYLKGELNNTNTCEVFSFDNNNTWRNDVVVSCPHPIIHHKSPSYAHGSLHWFIKSFQEKQILSFHLHTETFTVIPNLPVANSLPIRQITMCTLNNQLCVSEDTGDIQTIWSFNKDNMTWDKTYSINLRSVRPFSASPIASLSDDRFLLYDRSSDGEEKLVVYNYRLNSYSNFFEAPYSLDGISYYQSLLTLP